MPDKTETETNDGNDHYHQYGNDISDNIVTILQQHIEQIDPSGSGTYLECEPVENVNQIKSPKLIVKRSLTDVFTGESLKGFLGTNNNQYRQVITTLICSLIILFIVKYFGGEDDYNTTLFYPITTEENGEKKVLNGIDMSLTSNFILPISTILYIFTASIKMGMGMGFIMTFLYPIILICCFFRQMKYGDWPSFSSQYIFIAGIMSLLFILIYSIFILLNLNMNVEPTSTQERKGVNNIVNNANNTVKRNQKSQRNKTDFRNKMYFSLCISLGLTYMSYLFSFRNKFISVDHYKKIKDTLSPLGWVLIVLSLLFFFLLLILPIDTSGGIGFITGILFVIICYFVKKKREDFANKKKTNNNIPPPTQKRASLNTNPSQIQKV